MLDIFSAKKSILDRGLLQGAVDNHSHILFGVDDGIATPEDSLTALRMMEEAGLSVLWLTPHTMEDVPNTTEGLRARFEELKSIYHGPIELHLASEYMIDSLFQTHLESGDLLIHGSERQVLVETSTWSAPYNFDLTLKAMMSKGYRPVLAHPERYAYLSEADYLRLHASGIRFQLNYPSLLGMYGSTVREKAESLLKKGLYDMAGSDAHRCKAISLQLHAGEIKGSIAKMLKPIMNSGRI